MSGQGPGPRSLKSPPPERALPDRFRSLGFERLTDIQERAAPEVYRKRDSLIIAPTGSGKTECAVVPIFSHMARSAPSGRIRALYVTPLRALNRDVFRRITSYAESEGLTIGIRHGDTPQAERRRMSLKPPDVMITTPETLVVLLTQPRALDALSELEWVVIDEVHELLPSERGAQLSLSLERLAANSRRDLTRIGLSATVGNPLDAAKFVSGTRRRCAIIRDATVRRYDVEVVRTGSSISDAADAIAEHAAAAASDAPVLLFANSRGEAEFLASALRERSGIPVDLHHGSLSREVREEAEGSLREGRPGIVVCTSSLELGLDIGSVDLVVHYGSPRQASRLAQRIGRSRHRRGSSARGLIVTGGPDDECEARAILERVAGASVEEQAIHSGSLDVLAHHMVGLAMQEGEVGTARALELARRAYPFRGLTAAGLDGVLGMLDAGYLLRLDRAKGTFRRTRSSFKYYYENLSTIPDILRFRVFDTAGKRVIGTLDQRFVGGYGEPGNVFVLRGTQWRILNVDEKSLAVNVEPVSSGGVTVPYWEGESIPVDYDTAVRAGRIRAGGGAPEAARRALAGMAAAPDGRTVLAESSRARGAVVLHACFGTRVNATLAALLSSVLSAASGSVVESRSDAYRIALTSNARVSEAALRGALCDTYDLASVVGASLAGTHNANWRTWCVAKRFGIVGRRAVYERRAARFLYERYRGTPVVDEALRELFHDRYDLARAAAVLERVRAGGISLEWSEVEKFSALAEPILDHAAKYYASPASVDAGVLDMVRKRLAKTVHRLVCARCGVWEREYETAAAPDRPSCPHCRGRQVTATFRSDRELPGIIRRRRAGGRLTSEETRRLDRAWKVSSLIEAFGRTALVALSGYGVGADTAARILRNMVDEEGLFRQVYEAERQYVMTRGFWD